MCKYTVLACSAIFTTFITFIITITRTFVTDFNSNAELPFFYVAGVWVVFDCLVNGICLLWQFTFWKQESYYRLCYYPHKWAKKLVQMTSVKQMEQYHASQLQSKMSTGSQDERKTSSGTTGDVDVMQKSPAFVPAQSPTSEASNGASQMSFRSQP